MHNELAVVQFPVLAVKGCQKVIGDKCDLSACVSLVDYSLTTSLSAPKYVRA